MYKAIKIGPLVRRISPLLLLSPDPLAPLSLLSEFPATDDGGTPEEVTIAAQIVVAALLILEANAVRDSLTDDRNEATSILVSKLIRLVGVVGGKVVAVEKYADVPLVVITSTCPFSQK
jgi:hypothetical protein